MNEEHFIYEVIGEEIKFLKSAVDRLNTYNVDLEERLRKTVPKLYIQSTVPTDAKEDDFFLSTSTLNSFVYDRGGNETTGAIAGQWFRRTSTGWTYLI